MCALEKRISKHNLVLFWTMCHIGLFQTRPEFLSYRLHRDRNSTVFYLFAFAVLTGYTKLNRTVVQKLGLRFFQLVLSIPFPSTVLYS